MFRASKHLVSHVRRISSNDSDKPNDNTYKTIERLWPGPILTKRVLMHWVLLVFAGVVLILVVVFMSDYKRLVAICSPPPEYFCHSPQRRQQTKQQRPLVEYYVHGRGNGHSMESAPIISRLLQEGIDVRVFAGKKFDIDHEAGGDCSECDEEMNQKVAEILGWTWNTAPRKKQKSNSISTNPNNNKIMNNNTGTATIWSSN